MPSYCGSSFIYWLVLLRLYFHDSGVVHKALDMYPILLAIQHAFAPSGYYYYYLNSTIKIK